MDNDWVEVTKDETSHETGMDPTIIPASSPATRPATSAASSSSSSSICVLQGARSMDAGNMGISNPCFDPGSLDATKYVTDPKTRTGLHTEEKKRPCVQDTALEEIKNLRAKLKGYESLDQICRQKHEKCKLLEKEKGELGIKLKVAEDKIQVIQNNTNNIKLLGSESTTNSSVFDIQEHTNTQEHSNTHGQNTAQGHNNTQEHSNTHRHSDTQSQSNTEEHSNTQGHNNTQEHRTTQGHNNTKGHTNTVRQSNTQERSNTQGHSTTQSHSNTQGQCAIHTSVLFTRDQSKLDGNEEVTDEIWNKEGFTKITFDQDRKAEVGRMMDASIDKQIKQLTPEANHPSCRKCNTFKKRTKPFCLQDADDSSGEEKCPPEGARAGRPGSSRRRKCRVQKRDIVQWIQEVERTRTGVADGETGDVHRLLPVIHTIADDPVCQDGFAAELLDIVVRLVDWEKERNVQQTFSDTMVTELENKKKEVIELKEMMDELREKNALLEIKHNNVDQRRQAVVETLSDTHLEAQQQTIRQSVGETLSDTHLEAQQQTMRQSVGETLSDSHLVSQHQAIVALDSTAQRIVDLDAQIQKLSKQNTEKDALLEEKECELMVVNETKSDELLTLEEKVSTLTNHLLETSQLYKKTQTLVDKEIRMRQSKDEQLRALEADYAEYKIETAQTSEDMQQELRDTHAVVSRLTEKNVRLEITLERLKGQTNDENPKAVEHEDEILRQQMGAYHRGADVEKAEWNMVHRQLQAAQDELTETRNELKSSKAQLKKNREDVKRIRTERNQIHTQLQETREQLKVVTDLFLKEQQRHTATNPCNSTLLTPKDAPARPQPAPAAAAAAVSKKSHLFNGMGTWACGRCTYINSKTRATCEMCNLAAISMHTTADGSNPQGYVIVSNSKLQCDGKDKKKTQKENS